MEHKQRILAELLEKGAVSTQDIARLLSISRIYASRLLKGLREESAVVLVGKTNHARYVLATDRDAIIAAKSDIRQISLRLKNHELDESMIFARLERETGMFNDVADNVRRLVRYAFTEMLNNAIDHSQSPRIEVTCRRTDTAIVFTVRDFGVGAFHSVERKFHLPGTLAAIQEILKGKTTTDAARHSGEGIFFTSKMADTFVLDSYEKRLTVNNLLPDIFISDRRPLVGTRVTFAVSLNSSRTPQAVFEQFTNETDDGFAFDKTRITVRLFQFGRDLPSRSEAKRVVLNLDNFRAVELDFTGVETVGQAFADEIFRVWHGRHQEVGLVVTNANDNVSFMIRRAGGQTN